MKATRIRLADTHARCMSKLDVVLRTYISEPGDRSWPRDNQVVLPWCPNCKEIVPVTEVCVADV